MWTLVLVIGMTGAVNATANTISSEGVVLEYQPLDAAGVILVSVGDPNEPEAFMLRDVDLWEIELHGPDGTSIIVRPREAAFDFSLVELASSAFVAHWSGVNVPELGSESFDVIVQASAPAHDRVIEFNIQVTTSTPTFSLYAVCFPRVEIFSRGVPDAEYLTYPYDGGWLFPHPITHPALQGTEQVAVTQPGPLSMQWLAYYNTSEDDPPVLFAGTRDPTGYHKGYMVGADADELVLKFAIQHTPADNISPNGDYESPFAVVLGALRGDWYDAARFYREWAVTQPWTAKGPIRANDDFSQIVKDGKMFAVFGVTEGPEDIQYWPRDLEDQRTYFDVDAMPTHLYGWHNNTFGDDWGDWWPILPEYVEAAQIVRDQGDAFAPYIFTQTYDMDIPSWNNPYVPGYEDHCVCEYAQILEDGSMAVNPYDPDSVGLCAATNFIDDYTTYVADRLSQECGAQGTYLDVFTFSEAHLCYDPAHGHPVGGGDYCTQGRVNYAQSLRDRMRALGGEFSEFFVYTESENEFALGITELSYPHNSGDTGGPVDDPTLLIAPLFQTVYHDYQIVARVAPVHQQVLWPEHVYLVNRRAYSANIFFGHSPWAGANTGPISMYDQMDVSPEYTKLVNMIRRYMAVLKLDPVRDYVSFGERLRDPVTDVEYVPPMQDDWFRPYGYDQPLVYCSAYHNPYHTGFGLLLLNWTDEDDILPIPEDRLGNQTVPYHLRPSDFNLQAGMYLVTEFGVHGVTTLGLLSTDELYSGVADVPARSAVFLRFALACDVNCDGVVDFDDIDPFVLALSDPAHYAAAFPTCERDFADCNGDGQVDFDDIDAFVRLLSEE